MEQGLLKTFGLSADAIMQKIHSLKIMDITPTIEESFPEIDVIYSTSRQKQMESILREALGNEFVISNDKSITLPYAVNKLLTSKKISIAISESCTGGMISSYLTQFPGASEYFYGSIVAYSNKVKETKLNVKTETLDKFGAVSEQTAIEMALGARMFFESDLALSITGIAGPGGGSKTKPIGTFYIGVSDINGSFASRHFYQSSRDKIRIYASFVALDTLRRHVLGI